MSHRTTTLGAIRSRRPRPVGHRFTLIGVLFCAATLGSLQGCASRVDADWAAASRASAAGMQCEMLPEPRIPREGENSALLRLRSSDGAPIRARVIEFVASMPAMGAMPYMESRARITEAETGVYRAKYALSMAGSWDLRLTGRTSANEPFGAHWRIRTSTSGVTVVPEGSGEVSSEDSLGRAEESSHSSPVLPSVVVSQEAVWIDPKAWRRSGIETAVVETGTLTMSERFLGRVGLDESKITDVGLSFGGRVRTTAVSQTGTIVRAGEELCRVLSPEVVSAQQDFLNLYRSLRGVNFDMNTSGDAPYDALNAARARLASTGLPQAVLDSVVRSGRLISDIPLVSPVTGVVQEKWVSPGSSFTPGQMLYRIAASDPVWIIVDAREADLDWARVGQRARIACPGAAREYDATVVSTAPALDPQSRTLAVRLRCPNPGGALRPGMLVDVRLSRAQPARLVIPQSAILSGPAGQSVIVVDRSNHFVARPVTLGARGASDVEVLDGLESGERVVVQGQFLVASERSMRPAAGPR